MQNVRKARSSLASNRTSKQLRQSNNWKNRKEARVRRIDAEERRGYENIEYMLSFLACADVATLHNASDVELRKLHRLISAYYDDEIFEAEFPQKSLEGFHGKMGKPLASGDGDKGEYFRQRTLRFCAEKLYDMLRGSTFMKTLSASYATTNDNSKIYNEIYKTVVNIVHPAEYVDTLQHFAVSVAMRKAQA